MVVLGGDPREPRTGARVGAGERRLHPRVDTRLVLLRVEHVSDGVPPIAKSNKTGSAGRGGGGGDARARERRVHPCVEVWVRGRRAGHVVEQRRRPVPERAVRGEVQGGRTGAGDVAGVQFQGGDDGVEAVPRARAARDFDDGGVVGVRGEHPARGFTPRPGVQRGCRVHLPGDQRVGVHGTRGLLRRREHEVR